MGELESTPRGDQVRRSVRLSKMQIVDLAELEHIEDESEREEEEDEWAPGEGMRRGGRGTVKRAEKGTGVVRVQREVNARPTEMKGKGGSANVTAPRTRTAHWPIFANKQRKEMLGRHDMMDGVSQELELIDVPSVSAVPLPVVDTYRHFNAEPLPVIDWPGHFNVVEEEVVDISTSGSSDYGGDSTGFESSEEKQEKPTPLSRVDAELYDEVMKVIKERGDLKKLKVGHLKAYLRYHGLRIVGLKAVLLSRILEHLDIKDGGRREVPKVVIPYQLQRYDINTRSAMGPPLGKRWVAGKVINESYGSGKQQHTFTIEVYWSTGTMPLYAMRPLRIKGRNLYRMHTLRQPWSNEAERQQVLDEKHARGAEARATRRAAKGARSVMKSQGIPTRPHSGTSMMHSANESLLRPCQSHTAGSIMQDVLVRNDHGAGPPSINVHSNGGRQSHPQSAAILTDQMQHHNSRVTHNNSPGRRLSPPSSQHGMRKWYQDHHYLKVQSLDLKRIPPVIPPSHGYSYHVMMQSHNTNPGRVAPHYATPNHVYTIQKHTTGAGVIHVACSKIGCQNAGAKSCISGSCASCCRRSWTAGANQCPRHR